MFTIAPHSPSDATDAAGPEGAVACPCCGDAVGRAGRRVARLGELAGIGMDLARALGRQVAEAEAGEPAAPAPADPALAFSRVSRAVRLTLALEARFDEALQADEAERAARLAKAAAKARAEQACARNVAHQDRIEAIARQAIEAAVIEARGIEVRGIEVRGIEGGIEADAAERGDAAEVERLLAELDERLEEESEAEDFTTRPAVEIVARICRDLGVAFDPGPWTDEPLGIAARSEQAVADNATTGEAMTGVTGAADEGGRAEAGSWPPGVPQAAGAPPAAASARGPPGLSLGR